METNKITSGKWNVEGAGNLLTIATDEVMICTFNNKTIPIDEAEANAAYIVKCCNAHEEMVKALQNIVNDWDERMGVKLGYPHEEYKESEVDGKPFGYWSPSGAMTSSQNISAARMLLKKVTDNTPINS